MNRGRAFRWLMALAAFVLPAGVISSQRPDALGDSAIERVPSQEILFRHYL